MKKIFYLILILFWSCSNSDKKEEIITNEISDLKKIELIDSFDNKLKLKSAINIEESEFHPMYIGKKRKSISVIYSSNEIFYRNLDWERYKIPDSNDIEIYLDTSRIIGSVNINIIPPPPPPNLKDEYNLKSENYRGEIKSYPVLLRNNSNDTLKIGYGEYIPLIIEAKDSLGIWKPIQEPYKYWCGTGLTHFYIPPKEILLTSCKLYKGDYQTKMRLTFGFNKICHSNEFIGRINYNQFNEPKIKHY